MSLKSNRLLYPASAHAFDLLQNVMPLKMAVGTLPCSSTASADTWETVDRDNRLSACQIHHTSRIAKYRLDLLHASSSRCSMATMLGWHLL